MSSRTFESELRPFLAESDTYGERCSEFCELFSSESLVSDVAVSAWFDSEDRKKKLEVLESLKKGAFLKGFDRAAFLFVFGATRLFTRRQLESLLYLFRRDKRLFEGDAARNDRDRLENDRSISDRSTERGYSHLSELLDLFDDLLLKFYFITGHLASEGARSDKIQGLINVSWALVDECGREIRESVKNGEFFSDEKVFSKMKMHVFRTDKQLDALDDRHPFMGKVKDI